MATRSCNQTVSFSKELGGEETHRAIMAEVEKQRTSFSALMVICAIKTLGIKLKSNGQNKNGGKTNE